MYVIHAITNDIVVYGCHLQDIGKMGRWLLCELRRVYASFFSIAGLLGAGGYPGVANKEFDQFYHSRFLIIVDAELVHQVMPFLRTLQEVRRV